MLEIDVSSLNNPIASDDGGCQFVNKSQIEVSMYAPLRCTKLYCHNNYLIYRSLELEALIVQHTPLIIINTFHQYLWYNCFPFPN